MNVQSHESRHNSGQEFGPVDEYKVLRDELQVAKKYIFERPMLIVATGVVGFRVDEAEYFPVFPVIVAALLLFNFWFTANRLMSAARIVAYIQLELEERCYGRWVGWETCLHEYRIWISKLEKSQYEERRRNVETELKKAKALDALMYYPPIYWLHIGFMGATFAIAITFLVLMSCSDTTWISVSSATLVFIFSVLFVVYMRKYNPAKLQKMIERNRIIWMNVFSHMQSEGKK